MQTAKKYLKATECFQVERIFNGINYHVRIGGVLIAYNAILISILLGNYIKKIREDNRKGLFGDKVSFLANQVF